ncbi:TetR/AcrR family transcriptional regulator [Pollutimonas sp. M17]|uniref:TetR/AcrR family transcriptional regulator n=1 Tax=Pollutimonas sp. M17 TaxID=2962065 RepID=UPI0021F45D38|nr:TetR/AcrR family transcriptional regulator [Pollutimonas sp. M17]UYO94797.1 TetR/AcrR family transcriptional regulator [Pollutimonas sp. M17]
MIVSYNNLMNQKTEIPVGPGRPREFDTNAALDKAITRFSEYGYHGTSISDLNACLGLTSGSIYKAWGDKRGLFLAALDRYMTQRSEAIAACLASELSGKKKIEVLLTQYALLSSEVAGRTGCLVIESAVELSLADKEISDLIAAQQTRQEEQLLRLLEEGQMDGSIRTEVNAASMAKLLLALQQGMRILGKTGSDTSTMLGMVAELMRLL